MIKSASVLFAFICIFAFMTFIPILFTSIAEGNYSNRLFSELKIKRGIETTIYTDDPEYLQTRKESAAYGKRKYYEYRELAALFVGVGILMFSLLSAHSSFIISLILTSPILLFSFFEHADKIIFWFAIFIGCVGSFLKKHNLFKIKGLD